MLTATSKHRLPFPTLCALPPPPQALRPSSADVSGLQLHVALDLGHCDAMILGGHHGKFEYLLAGGFFG